MRYLLIAILFVGCTEKDNLNKVQKELTKAGWEVVTKDYEKIEANRLGNKFTVHDLPGGNFTLMILKPEVYSYVRAQLDSLDIDYKFDTGNGSFHTISYDGNLIPDMLDARKMNYDSVFPKKPNVTINDDGSFHIDILRPGESVELQMTIPIPKEADPEEAKKLKSYYQ